MDRGKAYGAVFNPILLAKSKEVVQIIEDIAYKHRFGCNDLILAVIWQCLGATTQSTQPEVKKPNTIFVYPKDSLSINISKELDNKKSKNRSSTFPTIHTTDSDKVSCKRPSSTNHTGQSVSTFTSICSKRPESSNDKNKHRNKNSTYLKNQTVTLDNVEVINIDDDDDDVVDELVRSDVHEVTEKVITEVHDLEEIIREVEEASHVVEESSHEVEDTTHEVEDTSHEVEESSHATKTVLVENVECSYFDMDCDEIDENEDHNDDDVVPTVEVIETKTSDEVEVIETKPSDEVEVIEPKTSEDVEVIETKTLDDVCIIEDKGKDASEKADAESTLDSVGLQPSTLDSIGLQPKSSTASTQSVNITTDSISDTTTSIETSTSSSLVTVATSLQVSTSTVSKLSDADLPTCISPSELAESTWTEADGPPRKKRLLDHDKKWHMAPKHNVDQDKYLALPGGIDPSDEEDEATKGSNTSSGARRSHSPPTVGIEIDHVDFGDYEKDFGQSPTNVDDKSNENSEDDSGVKTDQKNKSEDPETESDKEKSSKSVAARGKFSNLKKPGGLKSASQGSISSFQIGKIGRKGFGGKTDESGEGKSLVNTQSRKSSRMSSRQSKFRVGRNRKYFNSDPTKKSSLRVQADVAGTSGNKSNNKSKLKNVKQRKGDSNDTKRYKRKCGRPKKLDQSDDGKTNAKSKSKGSGSDVEISEEVGYVEESEWTTEFNGKESKKRSRAESGSRTSRRGSKGAGKSSKQKSSEPKVEVLVMDMDDIKFFDDIPNVMGSCEVGETSKEQETQADDGNNSDSDVIVLD